MKKDFNIFGTNDDWLDIGSLRLNIFNSGTCLRIGSPKLTDCYSDLVELEKAVRAAKPLLEIMFGKVISISDNGFGKGGTCVDIVFERDLI